MENSLKGLIMAAGIIITCVVVGLGFYIAREASATASNGVDEISKLNSEFADGGMQIYNGTLVSGSEVLNAIRKYEGEDIGICVKTGSNEMFYINSFDLTTGESFGSSGSDISLAEDITSCYYINPIGKFEGKLIRSQNSDAVTGILFTQK